jgi:hypothetical protein
MRWDTKGGGGGIAVIARGIADIARDRKTRNLTLINAWHGLGSGMIG